MKVQLNSKFNKLLILTRDGQKYHQFIEDNELDESKCHRVKRFSDLRNVNPSGYVALVPYPPGFSEMMEWIEIREIPKWKKVKFNR